MGLLSVLRDTTEVTELLPALLREAESYGKVELDYETCSNNRQACIEMGRYFVAHAKVWGQGPTAERALQVAIERAKCVSQWFPHPDNCNR